MRLHFIAFAGCAALSACAATDAQIAASSEPFSAAWCEAARNLSTREAPAMWATGACHERGAGGFAQDRNQAVYYYREAARRGELRAGADLARLGEAVPDADIAREQARQDGLMNVLGALTGAPPPGQPVGPPTAQQMLQRQMLQVGSSPVFSGPPAAPRVRTAPTVAAPAPKPAPVAPPVGLGVSGSSYSKSEAETRRVSEVNGVRTICTSRDGGPEQCVTTPAPKTP